MKNKFLKLLPVVMTLLSAVLLISCEKNQPLDEAQDKSAQQLVPNSPLKIASPEIQGRNLAANCFQCHGTNGYAGELKIAGESASGIISEFNEMKTKPVGENIMNVHARAYTDAEIKLIGDFISKQ
jgi:sulfide dehydrogenase cytochrome subunit